MENVINIAKNAKCLLIGFVDLVTMNTLMMNRCGHIPILSDFVIPTLNT